MYDADEDSLVYRSYGYFMVVRVYTCCQSYIWLWYFFMHSCVLYVLKHLECEDYAAFWQENLSA